MDNDPNTFKPADANADGVQDVADIDLDGDGKVDLRGRPVFEFGGRRYVDAGAVAPDTIPPLPEVIKTKSEYDISAVTRPLNDLIARWKGMASLGALLAFIIGFYVGLHYRATTPTSSDVAREALYDQIRDSLRDDAECRAVRVAMGLKEEDQ